MAQREDSLDLNYLSDEPEGEKNPPRSGEIVAKGSLGKDYYDTPAGQGGTSHGAMARNMAKMSFQLTPQLQEVEMKTVDVKCNYAKDRVEVLAGITLYFDNRGICKMPVHQLPQLKQIQRARPGRFTIIQPEVVVTPVVVVEEKVEAVVEAPVKVPKAPKAPRADKPKAESKNAVKIPDAKKQKKGALVKQPDAADKHFTDNNKDS